MLPPAQECFPKIPEKGLCPLTYTDAYDIDNSSAYPLYIGQNACTVFQACSSILPVSTLFIKKASNLTTDPSSSPEYKKYLDSKLFMSVPDRNGVVLQNRLKEHPSFKGEWRLKAGLVRQDDDRWCENTDGVTILQYTRLKLFRLGKRLEKTCTGVSTQER